MQGGQWAWAWARARDLRGSLRSSGYHRMVGAHRSRHRSPRAVHPAQDRIAHRDICELVVARADLGVELEDDAHGEQVVHLLNATRAALHLPPRRVDRLGAPLDHHAPDALREPAIFGHLLLDLPLCHRERVRVGLRLGGDVRSQLLVILGEEVGEGEVGQLALVAPHAEAVRERREDLERLARNGDALVRRHVLERAHVVQPVGELHHHNPPVVSHRHKHRA